MERRGLDSKNMNRQLLKEIVANKKILFVTSKNADYIRNIQEIEFLKSETETCDVIASKSSSYIARIGYTYRKLLITNFKKYDYIFFGFAPQLYCGFFPFIKGNKIIIDFFISIYDTMVDDRKKVKKNSVLASCMHWIDKKTLCKAKYIVCDTKAHRDYFVQEFKVEQEKFKVLYLEADVSIYNPMFYNYVEDKRILNVLYFGSILPLQGIEVILEAIRLLEHNRNIKFTIIGPIDNAVDIEGDSFENARFIPWLNQEELAKEIAMSDLCLAGHFHATIGKANRTIAGKTYIYKAMNKPVVLGDSDANHELFHEDKMHYFVKRGDAKALANRLIEIQKEREGQEKYEQ